MGGDGIAPQTKEINLNPYMNTRRENGSLTPTTGTVSTNIYCSTSRIKQFFLKPATSSTTFDVTLTDDNDNVIFTRTDEQGEMNELIDLPVYLNNTLTIENASADEEFKYVIMLEE